MATEHWMQPEPLRMMNLRRARFSEFSPARLLAALPRLCAYTLRPHAQKRRMHQPESEAPSQGWILISS